jgi:hypothetical protein
MMNTSTKSLGDDGSSGQQPVTLLIEQQRRWRRGERILVEELCRQFPTPLIDNETLLDLVYQEVLLREQIGEQPEVDEYVQRFPNLSGQLRVQFELDSAMQSWQPSMVPGERDQSSDASSATSTHHVGARRDHARWPEIEGYHVLQLVGKGGMAVVYKARHLKLNRLVALKLLRDQHGVEPVHVRRFLTEAQAAARLQHPHIVQIFEVGTHEGQPLLAYEFLDGGTLARSTDFNSRFPILG